MIHAMGHMKWTVSGVKRMTLSWWYINAHNLLNGSTETRLLKKTKVFETLFNDYYIH